MERERIVERDFMGLIKTDGIAEKKGDKEKLPKDPSTNSSLEDRSHNSLPDNTPSQRLGASPIAYPAGPIEGLSSSAHPVNEYGGFPSSTISLSMQNFRQQLGSNALLKGQQAVCNAYVASSMVNPSTVQHPFFLPCASNYPNSTATSKSATIPGNPSCAQLTIFYAGTVNVYDDVPADKAQGLMLLAASARSTKMTNLPPRSSVMSMAMSTGSHIVSVPSPFSPSLPNRANPVTPQASVQKAQASSQPNQSTGVSLNNGDFQTNQNIVTSNTQQESSKSSATVINPVPVVPRAVPQARKASLARFLEKRKERIITKAPYPVKKSPDGSPQSEESPSSTHASPSVDGCIAKNHQMTSTGLDDKIPIDSENTESCLEKDKMDHSSSQKAPKTVQECKITV
uniref:TSA: Wollemia nobilis Ref_Wollemi_Transcript_12547_1419 transcribed RNA sequence n=1 Tax=Wollemia nobilis TaxID=56998 RepID=A0A0C9RLB5_9CONI